MLRAVENKYLRLKCADFAPHVLSLLHLTEFLAVQALAIGALLTPGNIAQPWLQVEAQ